MTKQNKTEEKIAIILLTILLMSGCSAPQKKITRVKNEYVKLSEENLHWGYTTSPNVKEGYGLKQTVYYDDGTSNTTDHFGKP